MAYEDFLTKERAPLFKLFKQRRLCIPTGLGIELEAPPPPSFVVVYERPIIYSRVTFELAFFPFPPKTTVASAVVLS